MENIVKTIEKELRPHIDKEYKKAQQWFFKEGIDIYGVRVGQVRSIGRKVYREIKDKSKKEIFETANQLLENKKAETTIIAFQFARTLEKQYTASDFTVFERWLKKYVNNWAACDGLCTGPIGILLTQYPELIKKTVPWRKSKNRWVRRGSAVSLIVPVKNKQSLKEIFHTADTLLKDTDDMVQKGYGWMLKEASNVYPKEVFEYVMKNKTDMPRTALRYSIEKLPKSKRKQAMK